MSYLGSDGRLDDVTDEAVESVGKGTGKLIPPGWYRVALVEDEVSVKDWGTGLSQQFQILDGEFENRRVFDYLCVRHAKSEKAEEIARAKLKSLALAAGIKDPDDLSETDVLKNRPVMMRVTRVKADGDYGDEDKKQARPQEFVSVKDYRETIEEREGPQAAAPTNSPKATPAPAVDDSEIPF